MTRISDERLVAAKRNHADLAAIIGEPTGVLDALRDNPGSAWKAHTDRDDLLAEVDWHRAKDAEIHLIARQAQAYNPAAGIDWRLALIFAVLEKCAPPTGGKQ